MTSAYHLAQFNIATGLGAPDDPVMADFMARLDEINALAERSPGFVWRLQDDAGNSTSIRPYADDRVLVNLSVWDDLESFRDFVYRSAHGALVRNGRAWFRPRTQAQIVMWWLPVDVLPTVEDGVARLQHLREHGPSTAGFSFAKPHARP